MYVKKQTENQGIGMIQHYTFLARSSVVLIASAAFIRHISIIQIESIFSDQSKNLGSIDSKQTVQKHKWPPNYAKSYMRIRFEGVYSRLKDDAAEGAGSRAGWTDIWIGLRRRCRSSSSNGGRSKGLEVLAVIGERQPWQYGAWVWKEYDRKEMVLPGKAWENMINLFNFIFLKIIRLMHLWRVSNHFWMH